jgi:hypothetical protein
VPSSQTHFPDLTSPDDVQKRFSVFYLIGCVASALAGILAYGLMQMDGVQGLSGWRWIFIIEGVVGILILSISFC